jgi:hypothetical protein
MISLLRKDLEKALKITSITISNSNPDISSHFIFRLGGKELEVLSYSGRVFSSIKVPCESDSPCEEFSIEGKRLKIWLSAISDETLYLEYNGGVVTARCKKGSVRFSSLSTLDFPYWDESLAVAKETVSVSAERLRESLSYAKNFVSDNETVTPGICLTEFRDGVLYATDKQGAALIIMPGMDKVTARVHGKQIPSILKFLSLSEGEVRILECEEAIFFINSTGAIIGDCKSSHSFPDMHQLVEAPSKAKNKWKVNRKDVLENITLLSSSANWEDTNLELMKIDNNLHMKMLSVSGDEAIMSTPILEVEAPEEDAISSFNVPSDYLLKILENTTQETIELGLVARSPGGWMILVEDLKEDKKITILSWSIV